MAIPKRGSRNIVVNGEPYRWYMRRRPTFRQGLCEEPMSFAIEHADANGSVLRVTLPQHHPGNWKRAAIVPIVPANVEEYIQMALARGWKPTQPGKPFTLDLMADE